MSRLTGKVAIVTGALKGIGAGIAKGLGAAGAAVVTNYATNPDGGSDKRARDGQRRPADHLMGRHVKGA